MPMLLAPVVGQLAERWGGKPLVVTGLSLQAVGPGLAGHGDHADHALRRPGGPLRDLRHRHDPVLRAPGLAGARGRAPSLEGVASGANTAFRELGGVLGIAVLGAIFSSHGGYASGQDYVNGMTAAVYVGAAVVAIGAVAAMLVPSRRNGPDGGLVAPEVLVDLTGGSPIPEPAGQPVVVDAPAGVLCTSSPVAAP